MCGTHPTPSPRSPSPPKFPGSLCQGDISISPVSMATQRQVSARRMREPARATWGARCPQGAHAAPAPTGWGGHALGGPTGRGGDRSAQRWLQRAGK